jgi:hypothetical protein
MPGGRKPKIKGDNAERAIVKLFGGQRTYWQPEKPGQAKKPDAWDVPYIGKVEVKIRADGFRQLYKWLAGNGGLFVRADRKQWLAVIPANDLKLILQEMDELKKAAQK